MAQKQVALEHYASEGRCISWTFCALGYPGRATLTAWVREAFPEKGTVSTVAVGAGNHSEAVKNAAVVGLYNRQESAEALAEKVGVGRPTLYAWKNQFLGPEAPATINARKVLPWIQKSKNWNVSGRPCSAASANSKLSMTCSRLRVNW